MITNYIIIPDLYRLMVRARTTDRPPLLFGEYADVNLFTLTYQSAKDRYTSDCFTIVKAISNDAAYHLRFDIFYGSYFLGHILTDRTKKYGFNLDLRPLRIENAAFYTTNYAELIPRFLTAFNLERANSSQLDIAIDTQEADVAALIQSYTSQPDKYQRIKRRNDSGFKIHGDIDEHTGETTYTTTYKTARVALKFYCKTADLLAKPKPYIEAYFASNGFDLSKPVYRAELTIYAKAFKRSDREIVSEHGEVFSPYKFDLVNTYNNEDTKGHLHRQTNHEETDIDIFKLNSQAYLSSLFKQFFPIDIRTTNSVKKKRCEQIQLIDFDKYGMETIEKITYTKDTDNKLIIEKRSIKDNVTNFKRTGLSVFFEAAATLSDAHSLYGYLNELVRQQQLDELIRFHGLQRLLEDVIIEHKVRADLVPATHTIDAPKPFRSSGGSLFADLYNNEDTKGHAA